MDTQVSTPHSGRARATQAPIVAGVDTRGRSASAVVWAAEEAERGGRPLRLVTVRESRHARAGTEGTHGLAGLARRLTLSDVQYVAVAGDPTDVLLHEAQEAALLVVGRRGLGHAERLMVGRTSLAVAGRSPVPVVVVPELWVQPSMSSAPVVVGLAPADPAPEGAARLERDAPVLSYAFERAARLRVPVIVVCAWQAPLAYAWSPPDVTDWSARHEAALNDRLRPWRARYPDLEVVDRSVAKTAERALLDASPVSQVIVVGQHRGSSRGGLSLGSTTRGVLHRVTRPVAVVPVEDRC
jgi:nucleotide-binding universal stress UspA family protein